MQKTLWIALWLAAFGGCGGMASADPTETHAASVQPDLTKARRHLGGDVTYPATRAQVLAACADTPEFTAAEQQWFADHLPEGTYASSEAVLAALGV